MKLTPERCESWARMHTDGAATTAPSIADAHREQEAMARLAALALRYAEKQGAHGTAHEFCDDAAFANCANALQETRDALAALLACAREVSRG